MSGAEQYELYLLARHFGISAHEALCVRPAWELRMLLEQLAQDEAGAEDFEADPPLPVGSGTPTPRPPGPDVLADWPDELR